MIPLGICKSCGAPIVWINLKSGKAMPCNPEKDTIVVVSGKKTTGITEDGETVTGYEDVVCGVSTEVFISHFATCPYAEQHRKGKE